MYKRQTRILPLGLRVDLDPRALLLDPTEPNKRGAADKVEDGHTDAGYDGTDNHGLYLGLIQSDIIILNR